MLLITCPHCGPRAETEFRNGGEAGIVRPADPAALSDGVHLYAIRHSSDDKPPSMFWGGDAESLTVVSEPLDKDIRHWTEVPPERLLVAAAGVAPTPRNCQRIAELGSGWIPIMYDPKKIAEGVDAIKAAFKAAGRNPDELEVRAQLRPHFDANGAPNYDETLKGLDAAVKAGATMIEMLPIIFCRSPEELSKFYEKVLKIKDL